MNDSPFVTIGIPVYNGSRFVELAIKSVLNQTYTNFELIITDDGSTDNTLEIISSFKDARIKIISDGQNRGISYRLNQQIDLARGKYFARMDADDIMFPDRIERQVRYLVSHPEVDVIGGSAIVIDENNKILGKRGNKEESQITHQLLFKGSSFIHPTVFGKTTFFGRFKYDSSYNGVEDINLWYTMCNNGNLIILPNHFIFYRDPLKYKLDSFLFRSSQFQKFIRSAEVKNSIPHMDVVKYYFKSKFIGWIVSIVSLLNLDHYLIKKRNNPIDNHTRYYTILNNI